MARAEFLRVEVVYCAAPGQTDLVQLTLALGATVADALSASGLLQRHALQADALRLGVWGRVRCPGAALHNDDRVEVYRPLQVDPKEARRQRFRHQREKQQGTA